MKNSAVRYSPFHREHLNKLMIDCAMKGLSLPQLAKHIGVRNWTVYTWIKDINYPTPENYNKLADFFGWPHFMKGD